MCVCVCDIHRVEFKLSDLPGMVAISSLNHYNRMIFAPSLLVICEIVFMCSLVCLVCMCVCVYSLVYSLYVCMYVCHCVVCHCVVCEMSFLITSQSLLLAV